MADPALSSPWIVRQPSPTARLRLFCFPFSGGGASAFRGWSDALPSTEVCAVQPPGRETRRREPLLTRMDAYVTELVREIQLRADLPFAFYGHSLGALAAFEVARSLRRLGAPSPRHLFAGASVAPHLHSVATPVHLGPDSGLIAKLRRYGGTPEAVLAEPDLMALLLPAFRADMTIFETYRAADEPPLDLPITAFGGLVDEHASRARLEGWRDQTTRAFALHMFPGGHLFLQTARAALLAAVREELAPILDG